MRPFEDDVATGGKGHGQHSGLAAQPDDSLFEAFKELFGGKLHQAARECGRAKPSHGRCQCSWMITPRTFFPASRSS